MNTLDRDRNALKRLVESYGKKDVLNYVRRLNESADNNFPYAELRRLTPITYEEAEEYLYNNWVYESGENIPGYPLPKDVKKLLNGLESCRRILYGYTAECTAAFVEYFVEHPKYTYDLAKLLVDMVSTDKYGTYHATNEDVCSWYEFAKYIFEINNVDIKVNEVLTKDYKTLAKRPYNSKLDKSSLDNDFYRLPSWKDACKRYCLELKKEEK